MGEPSVRCGPELGQAQDLADPADEGRRGAPDDGGPTEQSEGRKLVMDVGGVVSQQVEIDHEAGALGT